MAKKRMLICKINGILRAILAHYLAKYQVHLIGKFHQIIHSLQFLVDNILKCGFYGQKTTKTATSQNFKMSIFDGCCHLKKLLL